MSSAGLNLVNLEANSSNARKRERKESVSSAFNPAHLRSRWDTGKGRIIELSTQG
jgi:hypothetical protein